MDFPPFVMVYHKRTKSPIHAEPKHIYGGGGVGSYYKMAQLDLSDPSRSTELSAEHSGFSFGYHANAGIEIASSIGVSLLIEYKHVVVKQDKFKEYAIKHGGDFYYGGFALNF